MKKIQVTLADRSIEQLEWLRDITGFKTGEIIAKMLESKTRDITKNWPEEEKKEFMKTIF